MSNDRSERGLLLVISSPSGAGKTTLCNRLRKEFSNLEFSVSYTTRAPRRGEEHGRDYFFVEPGPFESMIARDELAEYALVHGHNYGTSAPQVQEALTRGRDLLFDIDFQGGRQLNQKFPEDVVLVFILPPSLGELEIRLRSRGTDAPEVIDRRLQKAIEEIRHYREYHYVIVNDDLDRAYDTLRGVYVAERHRTHRRRGAADAVISGQGTLLAMGEDKG